MKTQTLFLFLFFLFLFPALCLPKQINAGTKTNPDIEFLRKSFISELLEQAVNEVYVKELMATVLPDGSWPGINYVDTSRIAFEHTRHLANLVQMSRAYVKQESSLKRNKELRKAFTKGLEFWLKHDFISENWWHNEIGTPNALTAVLLMMDNSLTKEQIKCISAITSRANIHAWGARPSGDRIKIIGIQAKNALFQRDVRQFELLMKEMESEIKFSSDTERGIQHDYSFHHRTDRVNNTLSYGADYAETFAEWAAKLGGTRYRFSDQAIRLLTDYYLDGMCKQMVFGRFADPATDNRDIARPKRSLVNSSLIPQRLAAAGSYRKEELQEIMNIRKNNAKPTRSFSTFFWQTEYYVHQRPDYYTSVRMFSTRNRNMEEPYNGEGLTNHHRADGANYISLTGLEYHNIAPLNDWQKIAGTTVLQKPTVGKEVDIQKEGTMDFVGAVTDDLYGAVGFDFRSPHDGIRARKGWFFFDEEYVCLGAGITGNGPFSVTTAINQCFLHGEVSISQGNEREFEWVFHDGIGYIFPQSQPVHLTNEKASGCWCTINRQTSVSKEQITGDVFKLWIDHGAYPSGASYEYIVLPATTQAKVEQAYRQPSVEVISNTKDLQAVKNKKLDINQAIFYKAGDVLVDGVQICMDSPGIIMWKNSNGNIRQLSVSDPSRKLYRLHLTINRKLEKEGTGVSMVWNEEKQETAISIELPQGQFAGQSVTILL